MRIIILFICKVLLLAPSISLCQKTNGGYFLLKGKVEGKDSGLISLSYFDLNKKLKTDTAKISTGNFTFSGSLFSPTIAILRDLAATDLIEDPNICNIYLVPDTMRFFSKKNDFKNAEVLGSVPHLEFKLFIQQNNNPSKIRPEVNREVDFIIANPNSFVSGYLLYRMMSTLSLDSLQFYYSRLAPTVQNSLEGQRVNRYISTKVNSNIGMKAPDFEGVNSSGAYFSLSQLKDRKMILLDFWGSWCAPCRKNAPDLVEVYQEYRSKGFDIVGIANDDNRIKKWKEAISSDKTDKWNHILQGFDLNKFANGIENENDIGYKYAVNTFPTYILIDQYGIILARFEGNDFSRVKKNIQDFFQKIDDVH